MMPSFGLILLAAGPSNRMGQPKQLLPYQGTTLIGHMLQAALSSVCKRVAVVLGAYADQISPLIPQGIHVIQNKEWKEGMASSIRAGLSSLTNQFPSLTGVLFLVCDQPYISVSLINEMVSRKEATGKSIIACTYQQTIGTPALFDSIYFPELMLLHGQEGAKKILAQYKGAVETISFPMGYIDIDTMEDYERLSDPAQTAG